jgi:hypothetical protein
MCGEAEKSAATTTHSMSIAGNDGRRSGAGAFSDCIAVGTSNIKKRRQIGASAANHLAKHNQMISGGDTPIQAAFQRRDGAVQERCARHSRMPCDTRKSVFPLSGKAVRDFPLSAAQNIDREWPAGVEMPEHLRTVVDTDEDQRGIQRDAGKGADGNSVRLPVSANQGGDSDSCRETTADSAEIFTVHETPAEWG